MPITQATRYDIPALLSLVNGAYRGEASEKSWTSESHLVDGPRTTTSNLSDLLSIPDSMILKYTDGKGVLAGCVYLQKQDGKLYLGMLSVLPDRQGEGIGKDLLAASIEHARQIKVSSIRITVISLRHELIAWYERHGYQKTGQSEPFHHGEKFGRQKQPLELAVLEKSL